MKKIYLNDEEVKEKEFYTELEFAVNNKRLRQENRKNRKKSKKTK